MLPGSLCRERVMPKKRIALILACGMMAGIGVAGEGVQRTVVTTVHPLRIAVLNICAGVPGVEVAALAGPGSGCLHDYQLSPRDMALLGKASLVVANGAGLEAFLDRAKARFPGIPVIMASAGMDLLHAGVETNAHVWVSPGRHARQVMAIADGMALWDPEHAERYRSNAKDYAGKLDALQRRMEALMSVAKTRDIVTFHEAFAYLAGDLGLHVAAVIEHEPGAEPSAGQLAAIIRTVRERKIKVLFSEPAYADAPARAIARETGTRILVLDPVVSGPPDANAYLRAMEQNLRTLTNALTD